MQKNLCFLMLMYIGLFVSENIIADVKTMEKIDGHKLFNKYVIQETLTVDENRYPISNKFNIYQQWLRLKA